MRHIDDPALAEVRKRACEYCHKPAPSQAAHLFTKGFGGGQQLDVPENLLALCVLCHARHHNGHEPKPATCLKIIADRQGYPAQAIQQYVWHLQALEKGSTLPTIAEVTGIRSRVAHSGDPLLTHTMGARPRGRDHGIST